MAWGIHGNTVTKWDCQMSIVFGEISGCTLPVKGFLRSSLLRNVRASCQWVDFLRRADSPPRGITGIPFSIGDFSLAFGEFCFYRTGAVFLSEGDLSVPYIWNIGAPCRLASPASGSITTGRLVGVLTAPVVLPVHPAAWATARWGGIRGQVAARDDRRFETAPSLVRLVETAPAVVSALRRLP